MAFEGMDPDKVQHAITQLNQSHQDLEKSSQTLNRVHGEVPAMWKGSDGQKFAQDVVAAKSDVAKAAQHITSLISHAKQNLSAQQATSGQY